MECSVVRSTARKRLLSRACPEGRRHTKRRPDDAGRRRQPVLCTERWPANHDDCSVVRTSCPIHAPAPGNTRKENRIAKNNATDDIELDRPETRCVRVQYTPHLLPATPAEHTTVYGVGGHPDQESSCKVRRASCTRYSTSIARALLQVGKLIARVQGVCVCVCPPSPGRHSQLARSYSAASR